MSLVLKALANSLALELDRIRADAQSIMALSIPSQHGRLVKMAGVPNLTGIVDATNVVADPQGLGTQALWVQAHGTRVADDADHPSNWLRAMFVVSNAGGQSEIRVQFVATAETMHIYALIKSDAAVATAVTVQDGPGTGTVRGTSGSIARGLATGWTLVSFPATGLTPGNTYAVIHRAASAPANGARLGLTGVTASAIDPGEPFSGDSATSDNHAYSWAGSRNASNSRRHSRIVDLLALREATADLDIAPEGLTVAQRAAYLMQRRQARNHASGSTFKELIISLIQTEDPSFDAEGVRVIENFADYSFSVEIAYNPTGPLASRVQRLIEEVKPAALRLTGIVWGTFRADYGQADVDTL